MKLKWDLRPFRPVNRNKIFIQTTSCRKHKTKHVKMRYGNLKLDKASIKFVRETLFPLSHLAYKSSSILSSNDFDYFVLRGLLSKSPFRLLKQNKTTKIFCVYLKNYSCTTKTPKKTTVCPLSDNKFSLILLLSPVLGQEIRLSQSQKRA